MSLRARVLGLGVNRADRRQRIVPRHLGLRAGGVEDLLRLVLGGEHATARGAVRLGDPLLSARLGLVLWSSAAVRSAACTMRATWAEASLSWGSMGPWCRGAVRLAQEAAASPRRAMAEMVGNLSLRTNPSSGMIER